MSLRNLAIVLLLGVLGGCGGDDDVADLDTYINQMRLSAPGKICLLYTSPSPRDRTRSRMPSSA